MTAIKRKRPTALTIAGSDSGGGAGIQADLKTFAAMGVHGACAITCLTAQNSRRVLGLEPVTAKMLRLQIEAVFEELTPTAVKTGMLFSAENIAVVAEFLKNHFRGGRKANAGGRKKSLPLVVDPVMVSTSGTQLLERPAVIHLKEQLLPFATLVTPNLSEAEILTGEKISSIEAMRWAAKQIHSQSRCAVLVKGGHLPDSRAAVDIFFDGKTELLLSAPFVRGIRTHGTGCTYSAAICAALALGHELPEAVQIGKRLVTAAIAGSYRIGKHFALDHFAKK
jgi:hydroxymethylpyrimidine/phosphomethylpyrimidine kinase